jgi:hypothetical protein
VIEDRDEPEEVDRPKKAARELPSDPDALAECRKTVAAETAIALFAMNLIAQSVAPKTPLNADERSMLEGPIADVLYKYDLATSPEFRLIAALGAVFGLRYIAAKQVEGAIPNA